MDNAVDLFGGPEALRKLLAEAMKEYRQEHDKSVNHLDAACGFGVGDLVSWRDYENDPRKINRRVVSRLSTRLHWPITDMVNAGQRFRAGSANRRTVVKHIRETGEGVRKTIGRSDKVTPDDQAAVVAVMAAVNQLD
jgi:hypothetical protein